MSGQLGYPARRRVTFRFMTSTIDSRDLVTALVICKRLGLVRTQRVHELVARKSDPMPGHIWAQPRVHLWYWPDVRTWAANQDAMVVLEPGVETNSVRIEERLGVDTSGLPAGRTVGGETVWDWGVAEQVWIDSLMNVHRHS